MQRLNDLVFELVSHNQHNDPNRWTIWFTKTSHFMINKIQFKEKTNKQTNKEPLTNHVLGCI